MFGGFLERSFDAESVSRRIFGLGYDKGDGGDRDVEGCGCFRR